MRVTIVTAFLYALALATATAQSVNRQYTFSWAGAFPGCTNCGGAESAFACSNGIGNWNRGMSVLNFTDIPSGYLLTGATATLLGTYNCLNLPQKSTVGVYLGGYAIDIQSLDGSSQCKCGTCDGPRMFTNDFFRTGWPGLRYTSRNELLVVAGPEDPICLSSISLNATFSKISRRTIILDIPAESTDTFYSCGASVSICSSSNFWSSSGPSSSEQKINIEFQDPVGSTGRVIAIDAIAYGQWGNQPGSAPEFYVDGQLIGRGSNPSQWGNSCKGCGGSSYAFTPQPFQFGWPNYVSGGNNVFTVRLYRPGNYVYQFAVSRVFLTFTYM